MTPKLPALLDSTARRLRPGNLRSSDEGATAVEYGMMVALIAAACVSAVGFLGQGVVAQMFQTGIEMFDAAP